MLADLGGQKGEIESKISREIYSRAEGTRLLAACEACRVDLVEALGKLPEGSK
jgi:hypothetical protein